MGARQGPGVSRARCVPGHSPPLAHRLKCFTCPDSSRPAHPVQGGWCFSTHQPQGEDLKPRGVGHGLRTSHVQPHSTA